MALCSGRNSLTVIWKIELSEIFMALCFDAKQFQQNKKFQSCMLAHKDETMYNDRITT